MEVFFAAGKCCFFEEQHFGGVSCVGTDSGTIALVFTLQALGLKNERRWCAFNKLP